MLPFGYAKARTEQEAIRKLPRGGRYIAGGTTLIDLMREEVERPERLVDINALPLGGVRVEGSDLVVGALARMAEVAAHPEMLRLQPLVAESLIEGASPQLRNMASIGGNLGNGCDAPISGCSTRHATSATPVPSCSAIEGISTGRAIAGHERPVHPPRILPISRSLWWRSTRRCASAVPMANVPSPSNSSTVCPVRRRIWSTRSSRAS